MINRIAVVDQPKRPWKSCRLLKLEELMRPFHAYFFLRTYGYLENQGLSNAIEVSGLADAFRPKDKTADPIPNHEREANRGWLTRLRSSLADLEFVASIASIDRLLDHLDEPGSAYKKYHAISVELEGRFLDEIKLRTFMSLSIRETEFFTNATNGWDEVIERFPNALGDIEEAYKCFALSRYAASVFHSLQIVENGLIELGRVIGATDHQTGWNSTIAKLKKIVGTDYKARTDFQRANWEFIEQLHGASEALKTAWRNKVSHAQGRLTLLTPSFTPDISEEILYATRAFMRRLAVDLPMSPDPEA